jgi:hypothetical protein
MEILSIQEFSQNIHSDLDYILSGKPLRNSIVHPKLDD